jgi:hypothetical protein
MTSKELMDQLDLLTENIEESLVDLMSQSTTESKFLDEEWMCLQIDFEKFQEIVLFHGDFLLLDQHGHQYDLFAHMDLAQIIEIVKINE